MNYETAQALSDSNFKRLTGVKKQTFNHMLKAWQDYHLSQSNAGRPPALSHADQLLVALQYWREYRTYFHIASDWNVSESTVCRIVQRVETALLDSGYFRLPGKKHLLQETERPDVIVIDVTETPIERPTTGQKAYYSGKKSSTRSNAKLWPTETPEPLSV